MRKDEGGGGKRRSEEIRLEWGRDEDCGGERRRVKRKRRA